MKTENELRQDIVEAGRRLYASGLIAGGDGNISVRLPDGTLLTTPSGKSKGFLKPHDLVITDMDGRPVKGENGRPSSEIQMHLLFYRLRPDVAAVVHAHPPTATGYAAAGETLDKPLIAEAVLTLGKLALAPYGTPGTPEVAQGLAGLVPTHDAILMANHGAVTAGPDLDQALYKMETVEHFAKISLVTRLLGKEKAISEANVKRLEDARREMAEREKDRQTAAIIAEAVVAQLLAQRKGT